MSKREMVKMTVYDIVHKLIGPINPIGETNTDDRRFENLKDMTELVDQLLTDIDAVSYVNKDMAEFSRKRAAEYATKFFNQLGIYN